MKLPCILTNRICYGLSAMTIGGDTAATAPPYSLTVHDFGQATQEAFDSYRTPSNFTLEAAHRPALSLPRWLRAALRQSWTTSLVLGQEWYPVWEACALKLNDLAESHPDEWPVHEIQSTWEKLWARFCAELRELDADLVRLLGGARNPTFEQIRFYCTTPDEPGCACLLPLTWILLTSISKPS